MPVKSGAGYDLTRLPMDHVLSYSMASTQLCCCAPKGEVKRLSSRRASWRRRP